MELTEYGIGISTDLDLQQAEEAIRSALADQGFGILTEIDVAATLKAKLGIERAPYKILGACNPELADRALRGDENIGLLLPCNVIVFQGDAGVRVAIMDPHVMSDVTDNPEIGAVADEARRRLVEALESIS